MRLGILFFGALFAVPAFGQEVEAVTFDSERGKIFVPVRVLGEMLGWSVEWEEAGNRTLLNGKQIEQKLIRELWDETNLVDLAYFRSIPELTISEEQPGLRYQLSLGEKSVTVVTPEHEVEISIKHQELRGWQGSRLVMRTNVSTGRGGATPRGEFRAGMKQRHKRSSLYNDAPMPYSVQVYGNIFIHGSSSVPSYPASHGCIRMPLTDRNAARYFFLWVNRGSKVKISQDWSEEAAAFNLS